MTGHLSPHAAAEPFPKHTHVRFLLDDGRELRYHRRTPLRPHGLFFRGVFARGA